VADAVGERPEGVGWGGGGEGCAAASRDLKTQGRMSESLIKGNMGAM
jgi:hypothetical protein